MFEAFFSEKLDAESASEYAAMVENLFGADSEHELGAESAAMVEDLFGEDSEHESNDDDDETTRLRKLKAQSLGAVTAHQC